MTNITPSICRHHKDFYSLAGYYHARQLKNGTFAIYEGSWVSSPCSVGYLEVVRDDQGKPVRFTTIQDAAKYARGGREA